MTLPSVTNRSSACRTSISPASTRCERTGVAKKATIPAARTHNVRGFFPMAISVALLSNTLLTVAIRYQIRHRQQSLLVRRVRKSADDLASFFREHPGPLSRPLHASVAMQDVQNFSERNLIVVAVSEHGFHQLALLRLGGFQSVDERQRDFALAQIVAHGFAQDFFARGEIQNVVDQLERDAQVPGVFAQPGLVRVSCSLRQSSQTRAGGKQAGRLAVDQ